MTTTTYNEAATALTTEGFVKQIGTPLTGVRFESATQFAIVLRMGDNNYNTSFYDKNPFLTLPMAELEGKAKFYMNELIYLQARHDVEKTQGREFTGKLCQVVEALELAGGRESLITLCWNSYSKALTKFA